jgi:hypothetical protein
MTVFDLGVDAGPPDVTVFDLGVDAGPPDITVFDLGVDAGPPDVTAIDSGVDSGNDFGVDAPVEVGPETGTTCGATECDPTTQQCCASLTGGFSCQPSGGACPGGGPSLNCSSASSCTGGNVCCYSGGILNGTATCEASCTGFQLCATSAECPAGRSCVPILLGYSICQ